MEEKLSIAKEKLPKHLGIIMDGNGRWAEQRSKPRFYGHRSAINVIGETIKTCSRIGIETLTLYVFSTENWERPKKEINYLMTLMEEYLIKERATILENDVIFHFFGCIHKLSPALQKLFQETIEISSHKKGMNLCLAINYGGRQEILRAVKKIIKLYEEKSLTIDDITEKTIANNLYTHQIGDPDLIIRTSGEQRISNFMLWQSAYTEFFFTKTLWPDFTNEILFQALESYASRNRRKGKI